MSSFSRSEETLYHGWPEDMEETLDGEIPETLEAEGFYDYGFLDEVFPEDAPEENPEEAPT